jgi:Sec-independent protein translocase protein TatA
VNDVIIVLLVILVIVVIIRGPKTIPQIGRMFGQGVREAREEINKIRSDDEPDDAPANTPSGGGTSST